MFKCTKMLKGFIYVLTIHYSIFKHVSLEKGRRLLLDDPKILQSQIDSLQRQFLALQTSIRSGSTGTTYTIWGRKNCPSINGTHTVYSGIAGGSHYNEKGNGVNSLCLPHNPDLFTASMQFQYQDANYEAHLFGSEYQFYYNNIAVDDVAPCAVCRVEMASSAIMIPAKNTCPVGWTKQFQGLMTANKFDFYASEYLCLADNPEYFEGSRKQNDDGYLFYPVKSICGSLPCPPYKNDAHLPCVVCTV